MPFAGERPFVMRRSRPAIPEGTTDRPPAFALAAAVGSFLCGALFVRAVPGGDPLFWLPSLPELGLLLGHLALGAAALRALLRFRSGAATAGSRRRWTLAVALPLTPFVVFAPASLFALFLLAVVGLGLFAG